jgi:hypothetical protein
MKQKIQEIDISKLCLWSENPRDRVDLNSTDFDIIKRAIEDPFSKWDLKKFVVKMGEYYDYSELPTVVHEQGRYVVYDGNRRIAVLKCLQDKDTYSKFIGKLFPSYEPEQLRRQTTIPCNVCDKETALTNIERKHIDNSSWGAVEREYFSYNFRGKEKSLFQIIDEQTGLISNNPILNRRFVKEEVLTKKNLEELGFFLKNGILKSNHKKEDVIKIFLSINELIAKKVISTRDSRTELKKPLLKIFPEIASITNLKKVNSAHLFDVDISNEPNIAEAISKKTKVTKKNDAIFGRVLSLQSGIVNDLYCSIDFIDQKTKSNKNSELALLVVGMSLRLLLDTAGREYFKSTGDIKSSEKDKVWKDFLRLAKEKLSKKQENFLSLTNDWLSGEINLEALLGKYAHGNITPDRADVLRMSVIIGDILEIFFKQEK